MLNSLLKPKVFCLEVIQGIDIEKRIYLTGTRTTVGSGDGDTLHIGAADVLPGQLIFQRPSPDANWEYQSIDAGLTRVRRGNPRAGTLKGGQWFQLGESTRIALRRVPLPAELEETDDRKQSNELPLPVALGALAALACAGIFVANAATGSAEDTTQRTLATTHWFNSPSLFAPALDTCLDSAAMASQEAERVPLSERDALFHAWLHASRSADAGEEAAKHRLRKELGHLVVVAQLQIQSGAISEATATLREMQSALPVSTRACPITRALRSDIAALHLFHSR